MPQERRTFQLPMMATFSVSEREGKHIAHALDFDVVCVSDTEEKAIEKLRLSVKTYVEYGLSNGWADDIIFPAPSPYWELLSPETPIKLMAPIVIVDNRRLLVARAAPVATHEAQRATCPA